jgi:DNA-binding transcriptional regulator YbjK
LIFVVDSARRILSEFLSNLEKSNGQLITLALVERNFSILVADVDGRRCLNQIYGDVLVTPEAGIVKRSVSC